MIFFKTDLDNKVDYKHYKPFDTTDGLSKTQVELEQEGYLVDSFPNPIEQEGKISALYYTKELGFWYEYIDKPLTEREQLDKQRLEIDNLTLLLGDALLGGAL